MYKKVCTPIVQYKKRNYNEYFIYDITIVNHKNHSINLYHALPNEEMIFETINSATAFVEKILSNNGFRAKITGHDGKINWLNIQWINIGINKIEIYGKN